MSFPLPLGCFILKQAGLPSSHLEIVRKSLFFPNNQSQMEEPDPHSSEFDHMLLPEPITVPKARLRSPTPLEQVGPSHPNYLTCEKGKVAFKKLWILLSEKG